MSRADTGRPVAGKEAGLTTVEFAIVAVAFMGVLFAALEFSRVLFTWNSLDAITQRAARIAAVCDVGSAAPKRFAAFDTENGAGDGSSGLVPGLTNDMIEIVYLNGAFAPVTDRPISYVQARIVGFEMDLALPFLSDRVLGSPDFATTIPAESLGYVPNSGAYTC